MTTAMKRKANDNGDAGEDCQPNLLDEQLSNPLVYIGSFLTGKDFSTFLIGVNIIEACERSCFTHSSRERLG